MRHERPGRHAPAFILLILAMEPAHGLGILNRMNEIAHGHRLDTAVIYRVLKKMEQEALITAEWQDSTAGPRKKVYQITEAGLAELALYREDMVACMMRYQSFLDLYDQLTD